MGQSATNISGCTMAMSASFLAPLFELAQDEVVKEKALEAAKQFFTNSNITINLLPALIAGALLLLLGLPLIALLFQPAADTSATAMDLRLMSMERRHPRMDPHTADRMKATRNIA